MNGKNREVLDTLQRRLRDEDPGILGTPACEKALTVIRNGLGLLRTDTRFLPAFVSAMMNKAPTLPCMSCGKAGESRNHWVTTDILAPIEKMAETNPFVRGFLDGMLNWKKERPARKNLVLRNGLCPACSKRTARRLPKSLRMPSLTQPVMKPVRPRRDITDLGKAMAYLRRCRVLFDAKAFTEAWQNSMRINI